MHKMRKGPSSGLFLTLLGLAILLICLIPVTSIEEVINASFTVSPGTKYGPYEKLGTAYHTRILGKSALRGEVFVEGEAIYLTVNGYNTRPLMEPYQIIGQYSFAVDPANDLYGFGFDNTKGNTEALVKFTLKEVWTRPMAIGSPPLFIAGIVAFFLFLTGLVVFVLEYLKSRRASKDEG